jgi:hypothetical protein
MTTPTLASTAAAGHRVYRWQGREYPSVTAILAAGVPKPFLARWAAKVAAEYAIDHLDRLRLLPAGQAIREVTQAPFVRRDQAADLGDLIHAAVETHAIDQLCPELPPEAEPYLAGFDRFLADHQPVFLAAEATVYSRRYGYAGTFDAIATLPDRGLTLLDVKTGNRVYPEVCLQLAAYAAADFIGQAGSTEQPLPAFEAGAVLHLRRGGYQLVSVPIGRAVLEAFLAALAVFRFTTDLAPTLLPPPDPDQPRSAPRRKEAPMTVLLLGMLLGALLVLGAALAAVWVQQIRTTRAEDEGEAPAGARREVSP